MDKLIALQSRDDSKTMHELPDEILTCIALSKNFKYIPALKKMSQGMKDEWQLRKILRALKGMTGPEAREFRLELNKLLRKTT